MHMIQDPEIVETLTDNELDALIVRLHTLVHSMTEHEANILDRAEMEQSSRNDTIIVAGWDEEDELEDWA